MIFNPEQRKQIDEYVAARKAHQPKESLIKQNAAEELRMEPVYLEKIHKLFRQKKFQTILQKNPEFFQKILGISKESEDNVDLSTQGTEKIKKPQTPDDLFEIDTNKTSAESPIDELFNNSQKKNDKDDIIDL